MSKKKKLDPIQILQTPLLNKGTAFTKEERSLLHLHGILPPHLSSVDEQIDRMQAQLEKEKTAIGKYNVLNDLLNRNEILFYQYADRHIGDVLKYIYTPTVGDAALQYSLIYKQRRGLYFSYLLKDKIAEIIEHIPQKEVDVIVVTDGERILGLGDQGIGGMTIPVGKLALYTLFAGIHPEKTLPIILDVGTNNEELLKNPLYLGWNHERIHGKEYASFVDCFVENIKKRYPHVLLQWEDFGKNNAAPLLDRYRKKILSFNDDIQGTAAVSLAAILGAIKRTKGKLEEQKVVVFGGGSAGTGISRMIHQAFMSEGLSSEDALSRIYIIDISGLIHTNLEKMDKNQRFFARPFPSLKNWTTESWDYISLMDVIKNVQPTILIGVSAQTGAFSEKVVKEMAKHTPNPIIFPLSNPTSKAEAFPEEIIEWTNGSAIVATGSPFQPVEHNGRFYTIAQCNNVYIFPGVGLGAILANAAQITDNMFLEAAKTLADLSPILKDPYASLFPEFKDVRKVSKKIAIHVAKRAIKDKVAKIDPNEDIEKKASEYMWIPKYESWI